MIEVVWEFPKHDSYVEVSLMMTIFAIFLVHYDGDDPHFYTPLG